MILRFRLAEGEVAVTLDDVRSVEVWPSDDQEGALEVFVHFRGDSAMTPYTVAERSLMFWTDSGVQLDGF